MTASRRACWQCLLRGAAAGAVAFLLGLAQLAALPWVKPIHLQIQELTAQSLRAYQAGDRGLALEHLRAAQTLLASEPDMFSGLERARLTTLTDQVSTTNAADPASANAAESYRWMLKSLDPITHAAEPAKAAPPPLLLRSSLLDTPAVGVFRALFKAVPDIVVVRGAAGAFGREFRLGLADPGAAFAAEKARPASRLGTNADAIDGWLATPRAKRVFVTGANADAPYVRLLQQRLGDQGFVVRFYRDCVPLCAERTVGAFFATSGSVVHVDSPQAQQSLFVPLEVGMIADHQGTGRRLIVIDITQIKLDAISEGGYVTGAAFSCNAWRPVDAHSACAQMLQ